MSNHVVARFAKEHRIVRIVSPRGMLSQWSMNSSKWKKKFIWYGYQRRDLLNADAFHATSDLEATELRALGFKQPIVVIPNGVSAPNFPLVRVESPNVRVVFLSRITPKKGIINLLKAWKKASLPMNWKLQLIGPDEKSYLKEVENEILHLNLRSSVEIVGSVSDTEKWTYLMNGDLFILPSFSENFGIVVAEAMLAGLPVITTTGTPWEILKQEKLGWWVAPNVEQITNAIIEASQLSAEQRTSLGSRSRAYVEQNFSWDAAASKMMQAYTWLLSPNSDKPKFIV